MYVWPVYHLSVFFKLKGLLEDFTWNFWKNLITNMDQGVMSEVFFAADPESYNFINKINWVKLEITSLI